MILVIDQTYLSISIVKPVTHYEYQHEYINLAFRKCPNVQIGDRIDDIHMGLMKFRSVYKFLFS